MLLPFLLLHGQSKADSERASAEKIFRSAMEAQEHGDFTRATSLLEDLRAKHKGNFAVDESLGLLYVQQGRFEEAVSVLQAATEEQPRSDVAHVNLGAALFRLKRNREALLQFQSAARINPKNSQTQQSLGRMLMEEHRPDEAAAAFARALLLRPGDCDLIADRAQALQAAGRAEESVAVLKSMPGVEDSAIAQMLLGDAAEKLGAFQRAAEHYARAVELDPSEPNLWNLSVEFLRHWTFEAAIPEFEAGVNKFPLSTRMKLGLGAAYFGGARYAMAIPVFAELLESDPDNALYAEFLGMACTAVGGASKDRCNPLIAYAETHPRDAKASTSAASMLMAEGPDADQQARIRKFLNQALASAPQSPEAYYQMGILKQAQGDWNGSLVDLEKAVTLKPDFSQAHYRLALAYGRVGRRQEGQAEMELQRKYSQQGKADLDRRLRQITTFIVEVQE